jgi:hypothetical protein
MKQELEGQTRAQMIGDFMNTWIGLQVKIVSSANQPFSYWQNFAKKRNENLKF